MSPASGWQTPVRLLPPPEIEPFDEDPPEAGQALVEYLFTIAFIALVAMAGLRTLGPKLSDFFASLTF